MLWTRGAFAPRLEGVAYSSDFNPRLFLMSVKIKF